ncbi:hypothetical protein FF2_000940 [Malus domestica]
MQMRLLLLSLVVLQSSTCAAYPVKSSSICHQQQYGFTKLRAYCRGGIIGGDDDRADEVVGRDVDGAV